MALDLAGLRLSSLEPLRTASRQPCPSCDKSCAAYCCDCCLGLVEGAPRLRLPVKASTVHNRGARAHGVRLEACPAALWCCTRNSESPWELTSKPASQVATPASGLWPRHLSAASMAAPTCRWRWYSTGRPTLAARVCTLRYWRPRMPRCAATPAAPATTAGRTRWPCSCLTMTLPPQSCSFQSPRCAVMAAAAGPACMARPLQRALPDGGLAPPPTLCSGPAAGQHGLAKTSQRLL